MKSLRTMIFAAATLALAAAPAAAADMATKAAPVVGYPYEASGFYFGVGTLGLGSASSVAATNSTSLGAAINGVVGYQWKGGLDFVALEGDFYYTNLGSATSCAATPCAVSSQFGMEQRLKVGFPVTALSALLPNLGTIFPTFTPPTGTTNQHPYLMAAIHEDDVSASYGLSNGRAWQIQPGVGAGLLSQWTNGLAVDMWGEVSFAGAGFNLVGVKPASANLGTSFRAGVSALY